VAIVVVAHLLTERLPVFLGRLLGVVLKEARLFVHRFFLILLVKDFEEAPQEFLGVLLAVPCNE